MTVDQESPLMRSSDLPRAPVATRAVIFAAALFAIICVLVVGRGNSSGLLVTLFVLWVFAPFAVLALLFKSGNLLARGRQALQVLSLTVSAASAILYGVIAFGDQKSRPAFWFLVMPLISLFAIAATYLLALKSRTGRDA